MLLTILTELNLVFNVSISVHISWSFPYPDHHDHGHHDHHKLRQTLQKCERTFVNQFKDHYMFNIGQIVIQHTNKYK